MQDDAEAGIYFEHTKWKNQLQQSRENQLQCGWERTLERIAFSPMNVEKFLI